MKKLKNVGDGLVFARRERGITLVALIITIIVMLILVGVSVQVVINKLYIIYRELKVDMQLIHRQTVF